MASLYDRVKSKASTQQQPASRFVPFQPVSLKTAQSTPATNIGAPTPVRDFAVDVGQDIASNIGSAGLTVSGAIQSKATGQPFGTISPELKSDDFKTFFGQSLFENIFGKSRTLKTVERRIAEAEPKVKEWQNNLRSIAQNPDVNLTSTEKFVVDTLTGLDNRSLAFVGIMGAVGLDLTPIGTSRKAAYTTLKNIKNSGQASRTLVQMGVSPDLARFYADDVVRISTNKQADDFLTNLQKAMRDTTPAPKQGSLYEQVAENRPSTTLQPRDTQVTKVIDADTGESPLFRSKDGGRGFERINTEDAIPAPLGRKEIDEAFVVKSKDGFDVIEARTGRQIGNTGKTVSEAIENAKKALDEIPDLKKTIEESPLSPRFAQEPKRPTVKRPVRKDTKLSQMAQTSKTVDEFVEKSGITREALGETVRKQGFETVDDFFKKNRPRVITDPDEVKRLEAAAADEVLPTEQFDATIRNIRRAPAKFSESEIDGIRFNLNNMKEALDNHPGRSLSKFVSKSTGRLPEVTGKSTMKSLTGSGRTVKAGEFARRGDDIVTEKGFDSVDEAQQAVSEYQDLRRRFLDAVEEFNENVGKAGSAEQLLVAKENLERVISSARGRIETAEVQLLKNTIKRELTSLKPRSVAGVPKGKLDSVTQKKVDKYADIMTNVERPEGLRRIEANKAQYTDDSPAKLMVGMPDDVVFENEMLEVAGLFRTKPFGQKVSNARAIGKEKLEKALDNIRSLKENGKTLREIQRSNFRAEVERAQDTMQDTVLSGKQLDESIDAAPIEKTKLQATLDRFTQYKDGHLNADFWALKAQSFAPGTTEIKGPIVSQVNKLHDARRAYTKDTLAAEKAIGDAFRKIYKPKVEGQKGMFKSENAVVRKMLIEMSRREELGSFTLRNRVDKTINISRLELIAKWMQMQQTHTRQRLIFGNQWTDEIFSAVEKKLTKEDKAFGRFLIDEYYPVFQKKAAPVYENMTGLTFPNVKNYNPSKVKTADIMPEHIRIAREDFQASTKPGAIKQRVNLKGLSDEAVVSPLEFDNPIQTAIDHAYDMSRFANFSEPVFFWRNLISNGTDFRRALAQQFDRGFPSIMDRLLDDVARGRVKDGGNFEFVNRLTANTATSILSMNPTQTPKQLVSSLMWALEESPGQLAKYAPRYIKNARKVTREMYDNSPFLRARGQRATFDRDAQFFQENKDIANLVSGRQSFTEKGMGFVRLGDKGGILSLGGPYYMSRKAKYIAEGMTEKKAINKAIKDFERAAKRVQQSGELEDIGTFQRGGPLARVLTLFQGTPLQFLRWEEHLIRSLGVTGRPRKGKIMNTLSKIALIHFNFMLFQFIADGFEFRPERQTRAGIMGPYGSLFVFGDGIDTVVRSIVGDDVFSDNTPTGLSRYAAILGAPKEIRDAVIEAEPEEMFEAFRSTAEALLELRGIPAGNVAEFIERSVDFATQKESDPRTLIYSDYALDRKNQKSKSEFDLDGAELPELPELPKLPNLPKLPSI